MLISVAQGIISNPQIAVPGNSFPAIMTHSNSAVRTYTFPDITGNVLLSTNVLGYPLPALTSGYLQWTGSAWALSNMSFSGAKATFASCTTGYASQNIPNGTAPTTPVTGDIWATTAGLFYYNGTTTCTLISPFYVATIGDNATTTITISHNLNSTDIHVNVWELTGSLRKVDRGIDIRIISATQISLTFLVAPTTNSLRVIVNSMGGTTIAPFTNVMTTLGDTMYAAAGGGATRLAGPTANGVYVYSETVTAGVPVAPAWINAVTSNINISAPSWASSMTLTTNIYSTIRITLGGSTALTLSAGVDDQRLMIELKQDGTGTRLVSAWTNVAFSTDLPAIVLSTTINVTDYLLFVYNTTTAKWRFLSKNGGF